MRWLGLVLLVVMGVASPAAAGTMSSTISGGAFGTAHIGVASTTTQTITITNTGGGALAFTVTSDIGDFTALPASGSIPDNSSQPVVITFTPTARGARPATLTVTSDDAGNPMETHAASGIGTSGNMTVTWTGSPGALDFGTAAIAAGTTTRTITIANPSPANEDLKFSLAISAGGTDYSVPITMDVVLAVNATPLQISVTFDPANANTRTGIATITGDDALNPSDTVNLTGVGQGAFFTPSPTPIDFGNTVLVGQFAEQTLTITNTGNQSGQVTAIASGNAAFTATVVGTALPRTLAPTDTVEFTVRFTPGDGTIVSTSLTVSTDGTPASLEVPVTGDGLYKAVTIVATDQADLMIDLGARRVGVLFTQVVTVTNTGETAQTLELPTSSAAPCTIVPTLPATLPALLDPAEAATFEIRVTPAAVGAGTCTITVTTDIPTTDTILVDWQGVAPEVALATPTTAAINFGVVDVDATQVIRTVVLDNTGSAPLAIGPCTVTGSARFSVVTSCTNLSVAPNASATLMVAFDPSLEASESGTLTIGVDALSTSQVAVVLSGVGADQRLDVSAFAISFGDINVNSAAPAIEYVNIQNPVNPETGIAETLHISAATTDNAVFTLANEGPFVVEAGGMIRLAITFLPPMAGVYEGTLTVVSDASGLPMAAISLQGRGIVAGADEGGGCCQTGGHHNAPVALLVLLVMRRRRRSRS